MEIWIRLESGQIVGGRHPGRRTSQLSEQSGLDLWRLVGATEHATVKALAALDAGADAATLTARADKVARRVDGSRLLHLNSYLTFNDAIVGRLLIAAGRRRKRANDWRWRWGTPRRRECTSMTPNYCGCALRRSTSRRNVTTP